MTRQQQAYQDLRIYRLRLDDCLCLATKRRIPMVTMGAMKTAAAVRGRLLGHYMVCLN